MRTSCPNIFVVAWHALDSSPYVAARYVCKRITRYAVVLFSALFTFLFVLLILMIGSCNSSTFSVNRYLCRVYFLNALADLIRTDSRLSLENFRKFSDIYLFKSWPVRHFLVIVAFAGCDHNNYELYCVETFVLLYIFRDLVIINVQ